MLFSMKTHSLSNKPLILHLHLKQLTLYLSHTHYHLIISSLLHPRYSLLHQMFFPQLIPPLSLHLPPNQHHLSADQLDPEKHLPISQTSIAIKSQLPTNPCPQCKLLPNIPPLVRLSLFPFPLSSFLSYYFLSPTFKAFTTSLSLQAEPSTYSQAAKLPIWC